MSKQGSFHCTYHQNRDCISHISLLSKDQALHHLGAAQEVSLLVSVNYPDNSISLFPRAGGNGDLVVDKNKWRTLMRLCRQQFHGSILALTEVSDRAGCFTTSSKILRFPFGRNWCHHESIMRCSILKIEISQPRPWYIRCLTVPAETLTLKIPQLSQHWICF